MKRSSKQKNNTETVELQPRTLRIRQLRWIDILNLALIVLIVGYVAYARLYPFKILEVTNLRDGKIPMLTERVEAGRYAKYEISSIRYTDETITVIRNIVNGQTIPLSASLSNRPAGPGTFVVEILIPANVNPGKYHFRVCYEVDKALDRKITECYNTEDFEVYLPKGVDPDDDGIRIPQDQNQLPVKSTPTDEESTPQSKVNLVEPDHSNPDKQTAQKPADSGGQSDTQDEESSFFCTTLGVKVENPLQLPVNVC